MGVALRVKPMRLVTFSRGRTSPRLGAVLGPWDRWESVVDLHGEDPRLPSDMMTFIDRCGSLSGATWTLARKVLAAASEARAPRRSKSVHPATSVRIRAPIAPRLLRDFIAFRGHIARTRAAAGTPVPPEWDQLPAYYNGNHHRILGPDEPLAYPRFRIGQGASLVTMETKKLDYEAEIGFVVGRGGQDIGLGEARSHLFGATVFNDFSARDLQSVAMKVGMGPGHGKDFANALGPCIVTRDELGDLEGKRIVVRVNGTERLNATYFGLVFDNPFVAPGQRPLWRFEEMVHVLSRSQAIVPGEVWGSGTIPGGCELERGDEAQYLKPGDTVEVEIEGIGRLRNPIASGADSPGPAGRKG